MPVWQSIHRLRIAPCCHQPATALFALDPTLVGPLAGAYTATNTNLFAGCHMVAQEGLEPPAALRLSLLRRARLPFRHWAMKSSARSRDQRLPIQGSKPCVLSPSQLQRASTRLLCSGLALAGTSRSASREPNHAWFGHRLDLWSRHLSRRLPGDPYTIAEDKMMKDAVAWRSHLLRGFGPFRSHRHAVLVQGDSVPRMGDAASKMVIEGGFEPPSPLGHPPT
jgi:hypothetical protein